jgi:hypothetical protein
MKKSIIAATVLAGLLSAGCAGAEELWDPYLRGVNEGTPAGALPPPGVYGIMNNYWLGYSLYDSSGHKTATHLDGLVEVPIVMWQTGLKVLGADYAVAAAQPFDYTNLRKANTSSLSNNGHWGTFNTILVPGMLSWSLPNDFHVKTGLSVYLPDASSSPGHPPSGGGAPSGNGYWTLQPDLGVSWLHDGWNLSIDSHYAYNFEDSSTHYTSGQELAIDYTASKTIGKWTFGLGAHQENQLTDDSGSGAASCATKHGCRAENYGAGPLLGYQFDSGLGITAEYNHNIFARNDFAGEIFNVRLVAAF